MKLYEIAAEYREALKALDGEDEQLIEDSLAAIKGELDDKLEACLCYYKELLAAATAHEVEELAQKARKAEYKSKADKLKKYIYDCMKGASIEKLDGIKAKASFRKGVESVHIIDHRAIGKAYRRVVASFDKVALKAALKAGAVDGAELVRGDDSLIIK